MAMNRPEPLSAAPDLDAEIARIEAGMAARRLFDLDGAHAAILLDNMTADIRADAPAARMAWVRLAALAHLKLRGFPAPPDALASDDAIAALELEADRHARRPAGVRPPPPQDFVGASAPRDDD